MRTSSWVGAAAFLAMAGCARTSEPGGPPRRPGLWEQRVVLGGVVRTGRLCLDAATDRQLSWWGVAATSDVCRERRVARRPDGRWRFRLVCNMGSGGEVTASGTASGDFASQYQVTGQSSTVGAADARLNGARPLSVDAVWQGACPAGVQPGDMLLPDGSRISMLPLHV